MAEILLIGPLSREYSGVRNYGEPPIGIHRLASYLRSHQHNVTVYDCNIHPPLETYLEKRYDIIGISVLNNTLAMSLETFIKIKKSHPDTMLIAGGVEATLNYQEIFDNTEVDIVVTGEGELPMLDLANGIVPSMVPGLITRQRAVPIDNDLLWKYYEHLDFREMGYREYWAKNLEMDTNIKEREVRFVTSSHCNRKCSFCSVTRFHEFACGKVIKPAYLTGNQIEKLLNRLLSQLPEVTTVYFIEDTILPTVQRLDDFCHALYKFRDRLKFWVQMETDKASHEVVRKLAESGVEHISFGVENCSPRIRKLMNKPQNAERIESLPKWCQELGIRCFYLIILFFPESVVEDLVVNYRTLTRWQDEGKAKVSVEPYLMPYRGAPVYDQDFEMGHSFTRLANGKTLKHPYIIYPKDRNVRYIMDEFKKRLPKYLDKMNEEDGHKHRSKDITGRVMVRLLGDLLQEEGHL